jgi:hypothetical protein
MQRVGEAFQWETGIICAMIRINKVTSAFSQITMQTHFTSFFSSSQIDCCSPILHKKILELILPGCPVDIKEGPEGEQDDCLKHSVIWKKEKGANQTHQEERGGKDGGAPVFQVLGKEMQKGGAQKPCL